MIIFCFAVLLPSILKYLRIFSVINFVCVVDILSEFVELFPNNFD